MYAGQLDVGKAAAKMEVILKSEAEVESAESFREINGVNDSLNTNVRSRTPMPQYTGIRTCALKILHRRRRRSVQRSPPTCELVDVTWGL